VIRAVGELLHEPVLQPRENQYRVGLETVAWSRAIKERMSIDHLGNRRVRAVGELMENQ
jgi:DNA-directed RNA polymerase beta subunit